MTARGKVTKEPNMTKKHMCKHLSWQIGSANGVVLDEVGID